MSTRLQVDRAFIETLINYRAATSDDDTRVFLQCVAIKLDGNDIELIALDGFRGLRSFHGRKVLEGAEPNETFLVHKEDIAKLKKLLPSYKGEDAFEIVIDSNLTDLTILGLKIRSIQRDYPNVNSIFNCEKREDIDSIGLNPALIYDLVDAIAPTKFQYNSFRVLQT